MRCPYCSHDETQVVETRESDEGGVIRRRRQAFALGTPQQGVDQGRLVRTAERARGIHGGGDHRMLRHSQRLLGESGVQQCTQFLVALGQRLWHPLRERGIEARALAQGGEHDRLDHGAVARVGQCRQGRGQGRLQRPSAVQDHVEHARGAHPGGDAAGCHSSTVMRAARDVRSRNQRR